MAYLGELPSPGDLLLSSVIGTYVIIKLKNCYKAMI